MPDAGRKSKRATVRRPKASPSKSADRSFEERINDLDMLEESLASAVLEALQKHKRAGLPVSEWFKGRIRWIQPKDIPDHF